MDGHIEMPAQGHTGGNTHFYCVWTFFNCYASPFIENHKRLFLTDSDNTVYGENIFGDEDRTVFIKQLSHIFL